MKKTILAASVLLIILIPLAFWWFCLRPVPVLDGREQIAGLENNVIVRFDGHAVPYIEARSEGDGYAAQGYVTARERMFQMDVLRRSANGQMSEVFGANALPTDRLVRTLGLRKLAVEEFQQLTPPAKQAIDAYTRGVNAYLSQNAGRLGLEFTILGYTPAPWHPEDCLSILKYIAYKTDESWRLDDFRQRVSNQLGEKTAAALFRDDLALYGLPKQEQPKDQKKQSLPEPATPRDRRTIGSEPVLKALAALGDKVHPLDEIKPNWGSTAFVIPNVVTRSRGAVLACDKHGAFTMPAEWFLCSINAPSVHVAGATIPGVPGIWVGRNEDIAWGSAALKADVQDIFLEEFKSEFDAKYKVGDKWESAGVRTELIPVRLGKDVEHKVVITRHGPVLLRSGKAGISLSWTGSIAEKPAFEALYRANHANSWQNFTSALSMFSDPPQLFVYADRYGNAGCQAAGLIPTRTKQTDGTMLGTGSDPKAKWETFIAFEKLPTAYTAAGTTDSSATLPLIAANQAPATKAQGLPKLTGNLILGHQWNAPYRANRVLGALRNAKTTISTADVNSLQGDEFSPLAPLIAKNLQEAALATRYIDGNGLRAIAMLLRWDGQLRSSGPQASVYEAFLQTLARRLFEPSLGRELTTEYLQRWPMWKPLAESVLRDKSVAWLPPEERTYQTFMLTTLTQATKSLRITFLEPNPEQWQWGRIHTAFFRHVSPNATPLFTSFALGPVPVGGTSDTLNSCDVRSDPAALQYNAESGPTQRMIVDMSDRDKFYQALSTGQSGHRFSQYRDDQLGAWQRIDLAPIAFSSDQLARQTKHRLILENKYGL